MATDEGAAVLPSPVYQDLKAWIAHQEAYELEHQKPAPLTDAQRNAIKFLRLPPVLTPTPAPSSTGPNYVGILMEYYQKRAQPDAIHWKELPSDTIYTKEAPGGVTSRICHLTLADSLAHESGHVDHFPAPGYGLDEGETEKRFANKKAAKSFAAKCAVEWMAAQGMLRLPGGSAAASASSVKMPVLPSGNAAAQKKAGAVATVPSTPSSLKRGAATRSSNCSTTASPPTKRQAIVWSKETAAVAKQVSVTCVSLNYTGHKWIIEETPPDSGRFSGHLQLDDYGCREQIGVTDASKVEDVATRDAAKRLVAEKALVALLEIRAGRKVMEEQAMALREKILKEKEMQMKQRVTRGSAKKDALMQEADVVKTEESD